MESIILPMRIIILQYLERKFKIATYKYADPIKHMNLEWFCLLNYGGKNFHHSITQSQIFSNWSETLNYIKSIKMINFEQ